MNKTSLFMKNVIKSLIAFCFVVSAIFLIEFNVNAATTVGPDSNGFYFQLHSDGSYIVVDYQGSSTYITIPSTYNNTQVEYIGDNFLYNKSMSSSVVSVTIPSSVIEIGANAFRECSNLTTVNIEKVSSKSSFFSTTIESTNLLRIMDYAFYGDSKLSSIDISADGLNKIGNYAFAGCSGITNLTWPVSLKTVGAGAFYNCTGLTSFIYNGEEDEWLAISYTKASDSSYDCGSHPNYYTNNVQFRKTTYNYSYAEYSYYSPTSFSASGVTTSIADYLFAGFSGLTTVDLTGVTSIGAGAFNNCSSITSLTLTDGLTSIGDGAFAGCSGITTVDLYDSLTYLGKEAFSGAGGIKTIYLGTGLTAILDHTFYNCTGLKTITVCNNVSSIADNAFEGCSSLTTVTVMSYSVAEEYFNNYSSSILIKYLDGSSVEKYTDSTLTGYSALYNGQIGLKFYFTFPSSVTGDSGAVVRLYLPTTSGVYTTEDIKLSDATQSNGEYIFTAYIAPKYASEKIGAQLIMSNGTAGTKYTVSFLDYAKYVVTSSSTATSTATYVQKLLTYCDAVQKYFDYDAGTIPSGLLSSMTSISGYDSTVSDSGFIGTSIVLEDDLSLKFYFSGDRENITFTFNRVNSVSYDDIVSCEYLSDANITVYTITGFTFGKTAFKSDYLSLRKSITLSSDGVSIGDYYFYSYLKSAANSGDDKLIYLSKAMYTLESASVGTETAVR